MLLLLGDPRIVRFAKLCQERHIGGDVPDASG
jgi:hypothetical protein